jgi:hypothetical protein
MNEDIEKRVNQFVALRDLKDGIKARHKEELREVEAMLAQIEGIISSFMRDNKLENLRTKAGTCYTSTRFSAPLADPDLFMKYVIENKAFDLLDRRANVSAVKDFVEAHKTLPPGCNLNGVETLGVQRARGTATTKES